MDLQQAADILRHPGDDMHAWTAAGAYVVSYYNAHPELLRPMRLTKDAAPALFFVDTQLTPNQALLPSGALWCRYVTIARCGTQDYHATEIGVDGSGMVEVVRDASDVFDAAAMASFEGVPVTMDHPDDMVDPSNWKTLSVGHVQNVRRSGDYLLGDLIVQDTRAIDAIRQRGWKGISCGYDAAYSPAGHGRYRQVDIRGNHVAILPPNREPRCGPICAIGDAAPRTRLGGLCTNDQFSELIARIRDKHMARDQLRPEYSPERTPMGKLPQAGPVGGELIQLLDNRFTYYIGTDGAGRVGLYRHGTAEGNTDRYNAPAQMERLTRDARTRDAIRQAQGKGVAAKVKSFWAGRA
jgi:hypothetical protein